ncbi:MAG: hypothetical protein KatS3mg105_3768 [Gemmatales bacterium]|nr:MAG: hypothetical protein KatS3mg105_3768 [Gemmatales bacterium]
MAEAEGIKEANDEDLRRFDQSRKDKKVSNEEWESKTDADSRIARMKDGTTRLAYKAEHVVDMQSDLVLAATISPADHSDAQTLCDSVMQAQINVGEKVEIEEAVADKGYHKASTLEMWRVHEVADVHSGAEKETSSSLDRQAAGVSGGGVREPSSRAWRAGQTAATTAERVDGTKFCPCV